MNKSLTEQIAIHILSELNIIPSTFVDKSQNIRDYLLSEKISFEDEDSKQIKNNVYGVQCNIEQKDLKILVGNCSIEQNIIENAVIIQLQDSPTYGIYYSYSLTEVVDSEVLIAVSVDGKSWINCNIYLQATLLAAMEHTKQIGCFWTKCNNYKAQFNLLTSFINYHEEYIENQI